ncbi:MAG: hypothetical protein M3445_02005, partial [Actinomycetota bacterium]|nr:hypothetical protein [Actinomycetota bacterium]
PCDLGSHRGVQQQRAKTGQPVTEAIEVSQDTIRLIGLAYLVGGILCLVVSALGWGHRVVYGVIGLVGAGYGLYIITQEPYEIIGSWFLLVVPYLASGGALIEFLKQRQQAQEPQSWEGQQPYQGQQPYPGQQPDGSPPPPPPPPPRRR